MGGVRPLRQSRITQWFSSSSPNTPSSNYSSSLHPPLAFTTHTLPVTSPRAIHDSHLDTQQNDAPQQSVQTSHLSATYGLRTRPHRQERHPPDTHFGDPWPRPKAPRHFRLTYGNINGFDTEISDNPKVEQLRQWFQELQPDLFLGCEAQINWAKMPWEASLDNWFRTQDPVRSITAYNRHESDVHHQRQFGGTFAIAFGESTSRIVSMGTDSSNLGRWAWVQYKGRNDITTTIYVIYRPVKQPRSALLSTYMHHSRYFERHNDRTCPRKALLRDLDVELRTRLASGQRLIVAGDFNECVHSGEIASFFSALNMRDAVLSSHPHLHPPPTSLRGSQTIDAIWISDGLSTTSSTWLSFAFSPGDHRAAVVDFNLEVLLGEPLLRVSKPKGRRLNTTILSAKESYLTLLSGHFERHKLLEKLYALASTSWQNRQTDFREALNRLDDQRCEGMRYAEKRCRSFRTGEVSFSPELNMLAKQRQLFRLLVKYRSGKHVRRRTIARLARQCHIVDSFAYTLESAQSKFKQVDLQYRQLKPKSAALRSTFLLEILEDGTSSDARVKAVRQLLQHERTRQMFRYLANLDGNGRGTSVDSVDELIHNGTTLTHQTQTPMEECLARTFSARFRLTEGSPFLTEPLISLLGPFAINGNAQSVLHGNFHPSLNGSHGTIPGTAATLDFIHSMKSPSPPLPPIPTHISAQHFTKYWRKAKESTSSSLSGFHFGHYKAAVDVPLLAEFHSFITELAFRTGTPLTRWQQGLQIVLEKSPGVRLATKMRAILLMEADFNFGNKVYVGSRMLWNAITAHQILPELYGGVKGRRADHMALARVLLANTMLQKRCPFAIASVDAQSCYDRIAHVPAALCCQRWGVPSPIMHTMLLTIQMMKFFLRTAFGDSSTFYGGGFPRFQGICQGNGAGPAIWLAISTCLLLGMYRQCERTAIRSPLSMESLSLLALLFVDDSDLLAFGTSPESDPTLVLHSLQQAVTTWQRLLTASGGSLSAEKCSWSLMAFAWSQGRWRLRTKESLPGDITIYSPSGLPQAIHRVNPSEAITVVGSIQALDGNMRHQLHALQSICDHWAGILARQALPRHFAWALLRFKIWPRLRYPLTCTTISRNQGKKLMGRLYRFLLPRMGSNRNIPCALRHGPFNLLGLALPDPYIYQGAQQVTTFLQLFGSPTNEGRLLRISLEQLQLEVGIKAPIFTTPYSTYGFLATPCWLTSLWEFISHYQITLEAIYPLGLPQPARDIHLMDAVFETNIWDQPQVKTINQWRLHRKILLLSDCITGDGLRVRLELLQGPWLDATQDAQWEWWYSPTTEQLLRNRSGRWMAYTAVSARVTRQGSVPFLPLSALPLNDLPPILYRATVYCTPSLRVLYEGSSPSTPQYAHSTNTTVAATIASWDIHLTWPLHHSQFPDNGASVAHAIRQGTAHGACDGSFMPSLTTQYAAAAWALEDSLNPGNNICTGTTLLSGRTGEINAYRAELQGLHALLLALLAISETHSISSGSVILFCDNEQVVHRASQTTDNTVRNALRHHDLLRAITALTASLPFPITFLHIKGHQARNVDDAAAYPRPVQLNVHCDDMAKTCLQTSLHSPLDLSQARYKLKGEHSRCLLAGAKVISHTCDTVTQHCTTAMGKDYLLRKGNVTAETWDLINWPAIGLAISGKTEMYRLWASKFSYNQSATGTNMRRWGLWPSANCPCCGALNETSWHIISCTNGQVATARDKGINELTHWMVTTSTNPYIIHCFINGLRWGPTFSAHALSPDILIAAQAQDSIGLTNTFVARTALTWEALQGQFYSTIGSRRSARIWASGLVSKLLSICHAAWVARNAIVHDRALRGTSIHEHNQLAHTINEQFSLGITNLLPEDLHLIQSRTLAQVLELSAPQRRLWVQTILWARQYGSHSIAAESASMSHIMRNWLNGDH